MSIIGGKFRHSLTFCTSGVLEKDVPMFLDVSTPLQCDMTLIIAPHENHLKYRNLYCKTHLIQQYNYIGCWRHLDMQTCRIDFRESAPLVLGSCSAYIASVELRKDL